MATTAPPPPPACPSATCRSAYRAPGAAPTPPSRATEARRTGPATRWRSAAWWGSARGPPRAPR
eukprot:177633-Prorocentrum_minimum.AAC.1